MLSLKYYSEEDLKNITQTYVKFYSKNKDKETLEKINEIDNHLILDRFSEENKDVN